MKKILIISSVTLLYIIGISYALAYLPFADTPPWVASLFAKKWHGTVAWMKIRHTVVVIVAAVLLSLLLLKYDKRTALVHAFVIGALSVLFGVTYKLLLCYLYNLQSVTGMFTWMEVTDYLSVCFALPLFVFFVEKSFGSKG